MTAPKNLIIAVVITLFIAGGAGFYGGMTYGKSVARSRGPGGQFTLNGARSGDGTFAVNRLRQGTGFVSGSILSKDDKSITVKNSLGGSQIIFLAPSTAIGKTTAGTTSDLAIGESVMVNGTPNNDGTITAANIQIRPAGSPDLGGGRGLDGGNVPINK